MRRRTLTLAAALCACLAAAVTLALAGETVTVTIEGSFHPDKLGAPTNAAFTGRFVTPTGTPPPPVSGLTAFLPAGMTLDTQGAGTCSTEVLERSGAIGCPLSSRAGFGGGVGDIEIGHEVLHESFVLDLFFASKQPRHLMVLAYVLGSTPVVVELVLVARQIPAPKPYGLAFAVDVPPIRTLPGASDASVEHAFITFGSTNVAYYETIRGKRKLVHVKGVIVPRSCPRGGFPVAADISFADGTTTTSRTRVPCPQHP